MRPNNCCKICWCSLLVVCFVGLPGLINSQTVEAVIRPDLVISSEISSHEQTDEIKVITNSSESGGSQNEESMEFNPEIIPINQNNAADSCFNRTLPVDCSNDNSTLQAPIGSRFTATVSGEASSSVSKFIFLSKTDEEMVSFTYNTNSREGIVSIRSLVNNTQVNKNITTVEFDNHRSDFPSDFDGKASLPVTFVMVLTNTTASFTVNNFVYTILNVNFAEYPISISKIQVQGLDKSRIHIQPFLTNEKNSESCTIEPPYYGSGVKSSNPVSDESLVLFPYALTCLTRNLFLPEQVPAGSQILIGMPASISVKSTKTSFLTQVILSSKSGVVIFNLMISDKGVFIKSGKGTDIIHSKGGYFPFISFGFQSYSIKITFTSLFVTILINGFRAFDHIPIPEREVVHSIFVNGVARDPTFTFLPNRSCTKFSYSVDAECSLDGIIPDFKSLGSLDDNTHAEATVAVRMVPSDKDSEKKTQINFKNRDENTELNVQIKGKNAVLITNTTDLTKTQYDNNGQEDLFIVRVSNAGGMKRSYFNNVETSGMLNVGDVITDLSVSIKGDQISMISSEFTSLRKSCVLDQHRGSYVSTICEADRLCFASGTDGSPTGGVLHFIGGFLNGSIKVSIYTKKDDLMYQIEYEKQGKISVKRTTSVKAENVIYSGHYLNSEGGSRTAISVKDLGQFFLIYITGREITRISKGGLGTDGNISCVQLVSNPSDNKSIYFEIE